MKYYKLKVLIENFTFYYYSNSNVISNENEIISCAKINGTIN